MKNNKHNNSGFTLVELIVVMCLMGIIMGAVINLMKPTSDLYKTTNTYLSQEESVSTIYKALEDDLMYATGIYVYCTDNADDYNINTVVQNIKDNGGPDLALSNCYVLDNTSVRTATSGSANANAKGSIKKYAFYGGRYVDVTVTPGTMTGTKLYKNYFALKNQAFMDADTYKFGVVNPADPREPNSVYSLDIQTEVYRPQYNGSTNSYDVSAEKSFSAMKSVDFINLKADVKTFDANHLESSNGTNSAYIYIFYDRKDIISEAAATVSFTCYVKNPDDGTWVESFSGSYPEGSDISVDVQQNSEARNTEAFIYNDYVYERTGEYSTYVDDTWAEGATYYDLCNLEGPGPVNLYAVYKKSHTSTMPQVTVTAYDYDDVDGSKAPIWTESVTYGGNLTHDYTTILGYTVLVYGDDEITKAYLADLNTEVQHTQFTHLTTSFEIYYKKYKLYNVYFKDCDGNLIKGFDGVYDGINVDGTIKNDYCYIREGSSLSVLPDATAYMTKGSGTYSWCYEDGSVVDVTAPITDSIVIKLVFTPAEEPTPSNPEEPENPPSSGDIAINASLVGSGDDYLNYKIVFDNTASSTDYIIPLGYSYIINTDKELVGASYDSSIKDVQISGKDAKVFIPTGTVSAGNSNEYYVTLKIKTSVGSDPAILTPAADNNVYVFSCNNIEFKYIYVNLYNAVYDIYVIPENSTIPVNIKMNCSDQQGHYDISAYSNTNCRVVVIAHGIPYNVNLTVAFWKNQWVNNSFTIQNVTINKDSLGNRYNYNAISG